MKVLYIAPEDFYETGGTRRPLEVIRRIGQHGVDPYVVQPSISNDALITKIGAFRSLKKIISAYDFGSELEKGGFDLIVSTSEAPETTIPGYLLSKKYGIPWTVIFQLPVDLRRTPAATTPIFKDPFWTPQQLMVSFATKNTIPLTVSKAPILQSTIRPDSFIKIEIPIAVDWKSIRKTTPRREPFDALYLARLVREKGLFDIVKIWKKVVEKEKNAKLVVVGKFQRKEEKSEFFRLLNKFGLIDNVIYKGFLEEKKKFSYIKAANLMVYPSKLDAFPIAVLEALACGTPIVAYDIPPITFNYQTKAVKTVAVGDTKAFAKKVLDMISIDRSSMREYSEASKEFARKYNWDKVAETEAEAYEKFLNLWVGNK